MSNVIHRKRRSTVLATLSVLSMVAVAACGGDDDDGTDTVDTEAVESTDAGASETTTAGSDTETTDATEGTDSETTDGGGDAAPANSESERHLTEDEGTPVKGGTLQYGVEADTANAWPPYRASYASSGYVVLSSVTDSLFGVTEAGETVPQLVESVEHNDDYTQWTLHLREGITFTDGTPFDAAAVKFNIDTCVNAPLTAGAYSTVGNVTASGQDVVIDTKGGPWVALPMYFSSGSCGYMLSPKWLGTLPDVPQRNDKTPVYDAELAATPADGDPAKPVGLGAFVFESYTPGNGNSFKAVRNEDYWRGPNGVTGEDLPYLDAVEIIVAVDADSRSNALRSGQIDVMHTANADTIAQFLDDDSFELAATSRYGDVGYIMLNVAEGATDPEGKNAASPLLNVHCRRALAFATDNERIAEERGAGLVDTADGPYPPGSKGYLEDSGYPDFNVEEGNKEMDQCLSELGTESINFTFNTTNDPFNVETNTLIISMWQEAYGDKVQSEITPIEQGQYIGLALTGAFNAFSWRSHSGLDPDQQRLWWHSGSSTPIPGLALNFGRIVNPDMDAALETIKSNPDEAARTAAAEDINRIFGEEVYNLWTTRTLWGVIEQPFVNGLETNALPDGEQGIGLAGAGRHQMNQIWCDDGKCE